MLKEPVQFIPVIAGGDLGQFVEQVLGSLFGLVRCFSHFFSFIILLSSDIAHHLLTGILFPLCTGLPVAELRLRVLHPDNNG